MDGVADGVTGTAREPRAEVGEGATATEAAAAEAAEAAAAQAAAAAARGAAAEAYTRPLFSST